MQETRHEVLAALADGPLSGPELADRLDVSRAAVWKHVEALRDDGFEIESDDEGYRLVSVPEFGGAAVEYDLDAPYSIDFHESIASTNERARALAHDGESDAVVLADEQTGGRGRLGREWVAPSGGIWLSILVRPDVPPAHVPIFTIAAAVAASRALDGTGVETEIKWPNDVLLANADGDRQKLAGILTEMEGEADRVSWVIVGIGINANVDAEALPAQGTSLESQVGAVDRRSIVQTLLAEFHDLSQDVDSVLPAWKERAATLGQRVRIDTPGGDVEGDAVDVQFPGTLVVETDEGRKTVTTGDCEHLRPSNRR
jgi:BirA family biotin operon repressor/biotin-[acetyl-CoA-carboxylase] ligase